MPDQPLKILSSMATREVLKELAAEYARSEDAVRAAVVAAPSLAYSTGPSGTYLESLFQRWGIFEQIRARIVVPPPGVPVASLIASGKVQLGFQQASEMMNVPGVDVVGPLPPAIQQVTVFSGGIPAACTRPDEARALLSFLAAPSAAAVKQRHGMDAA
jgi:molybdate transport system substrate-binding protein